jgi:hypothetical protein
MSMCVLCLCQWACTCDRSLQDTHTSRTGMVGKNHTTGSGGPPAHHRVHRAGKAWWQELACCKAELQAPPEQPLAVLQHSAWATDTPTGVFNGC